MITVGIASCSPAEVGIALPRLPTAWADFERVTEYAQRREGRRLFVANFAVATTFAEIVAQGCLF